MSAVCSPPMACKRLLLQHTKYALLCALPGVALSAPDGPLCTRVAHDQQHG